MSLKFKVALIGSLSLAWLPSETMAWSSSLLWAPSPNGGTPPRTVVGDYVRDRFGTSVSGAGDVNADGYHDFIVGCPFEDLGNDAGYARVFSGKDLATLYTFTGDNPDDFFGIEVSGAGDVNGDGFDDVMVSATQVRDLPGYARVFSGRDGSILYTFVGKAAHNHFGSSVSDAGDINADGFDDVIVGAPSRNTRNGAGSGTAWVFSGRNGRVLHRLIGDFADHRLGTEVSGAGDVNADGVPDLIVGALNLVDQSGTARVYSGSDGAVLYDFQGNPGDNLGGAVSDAGDVNADGFDDVMVSVGPSVGADHVHILSGKDGSIIHTIQADDDRQSFGSSLSGVGDIDRDGFADVVINSPRTSHQGEDSGSVRIFSGRNASVLRTFNGSSRNDIFGASVSGIGQGPADRVPQVIVGAPRGDHNGRFNGYARVFTLP